MKKWLRLYWYNRKAREIREITAPVWVPIVIYLILIILGIIYYYHDRQ